MLSAPGAWAGKNPVGPQPVTRLPIAGLGYRPQSSSTLTARIFTNSLDFIDQDHLLLTFRTKGLLKRMPDAQPGDDDQNIHAVVLEVSTGKALRASDWRMHDHGHYLWPLQNGTFLVRERDTLYMTDGSLELRPYLQPPARLQDIRPSPDGKIIVVQFDQERHSAQEHERLVAEAQVSGASPPREDVKVVVMRSDTGEVLATTHANRPVNLPILPDGYLETLPGKADHWQLIFASFDGGKKIFGDVLSTCTPTTMSATVDMSLLVTCQPRTDDQLVQGIDRDGKIRWEFWWEASLIWPSIVSSRDGSRFVFNTLRATHSVSALDPIGDEDIKGQRLQVFDAAGGSLVLALNASPPTAWIQNFALSPDGKKLAILAADAVEIYDVPEPRPAPAGKKK